MLQTIKLNNFKTWRELPNTELGRITGLFGVNSAGKSSIIQSLLLLKQTAESPDRRQVLNFGGEQSIVDLGTFTDLAYRHNPESVIEIGFSWAPESPIELKFGDGPQIASNSISFKTSIQRQSNGELRVREFTYRIADHRFSLSADNGRRYRFEFPENVGLRKGQGRPFEYAEPIKCYGFPEELRTSFANGEILGDFQVAFEKLFNSIYYLGPLRDRARRQYTWSGTKPNDMGPRGERVVDALLAARQRGVQVSPGFKKRKRSLEQQVAYWLRELGLIESFRVEEIAKESNLYRVVVRRRGSSEEVALTDVGFGVSQVLPVLTLLYYVEPGSVVLLEHPEIHLHPSVQARLADVVIHAALRQKIQIIVESHSEHFLRRIQRRVAEQWEGATDQDVRLYFVGDSKSESHIEPLALDELGSINNWPEDFFGDPLEDIVATQEAAIRRKLGVAAS